MNASDSRPAHANTAERRTILDAIPAIAWCKLPDGSNEFVNQRWQDYTGIPADEARGQGWQAAVHPRSEEHTSELQSLTNLVCRLLLEKKKTKVNSPDSTHGITTPMAHVVL